MDQITDFYSVTSVDVNSAYSEQRNDVAMLRLSRAAPYQPLRVIRTDEAAGWAPEVSATIIGWGTTSPGGDPSNALLEANAPMRSDATCQDPLSYGPDFDPDTMVCAGDGSTDSCQGDSGGPLMFPTASASSSSD